MKDHYKAKIIKNHLKTMETDEYYLVRLKGEGKPINLDEPALNLLLAYYEGRITEDEIRELNIR